MAKINVQPDCGNAPRKLFLKDLNVALANGDIEFFTKNIQDSITWEVVGQSQVTGKENYFKAINGHKLWKVKELTKRLSKQRNDLKTECQMQNR